MMMYEDGKNLVDKELVVPREFVQTNISAEPVDIVDSTEAYDAKLFVRELQELCAKHNMTIFAGALGLRFIPRDSEGRNIGDDDGIAGVYWTQSFGNKEFIPVE